MSTLQHRSEGKAKAAYDPLSVLDEDGAAEPLDDQGESRKELSVVLLLSQSTELDLMTEQEAVIKALQDSNEKSNFIYRGAMLITLGLTGIL